MNQTYIGKIDRRLNEKSLVLPAVNRGDTLTILLEAMGRINFGRAIKDFKGITTGVSIKSVADGHDISYDLRNWTIRLLPSDVAHLQQRVADAEAKHLFATASPQLANKPAVFVGEFRVRRVGDTFINMSNFGKGQRCM